MQNVVSAAVLADFLFDEFDGKDRNPFREKGVRSRVDVPEMQGNRDGRDRENQKPARSLLCRL